MTTRQPGTSPLVRTMLVRQPHTSVFQYTRLSRSVPLLQFESPSKEAQAYQDKCALRVFQRIRAAQPATPSQEELETTQMEHEQRILMK
jgi:hypothetical protein